VAETLDFKKKEAYLDTRLADQILLPAVIANKNLNFTTSKISQYLQTNAWTIANFLGPCIVIGEEGPDVLAVAYFSRQKK
jgi:RNA 3'-terminal phosphate cyclase